MSSRPQKTKYPGVTFIEVPRPSGGTEKSFYVTYRDPTTGKLKNISVGRSARDDMTPAKAAGVRADLIEGTRQTKKDKAAEEAARPTIERLWEVYKAANEKKSSMRTDRYDINHLKDHFPTLASDLTTADLTKLKNQLTAAGKSPKTVSNILGLLRRVINYGVKHGLTPPISPAKLHFEMPKVDNIVTEHLTHEQVQKLLEVLDEEADQNLASLMRLALATGIRRTALLNLQWGDVDFEKGFITLRGEVAKSGKTSKIPLNSMARNIIEGIDQTDSPFLFPGRDGGRRVEIRRFLDRVRTKAELPEGFRPLHGLRHTYASELASSGQVDLYTLQKLLTHSSPQMTERYAHLADEALQRAANVAAGIFTRVSSNTAPTSENAAQDEAEPVEAPMRRTK